MKNLRHYLLLFLKGLGMGTADVIPSISSGTIALITGIYNELLHTIHSFNKIAFELLLAGKWRHLWLHIHGSFLLPLGVGIIVSLLTTVPLVRYLVAQYPIEIWSFFFGLSLISAIVIYQQIKRFTLLALCTSCLGGFIAYIITQATPLISPTATWFIFISGALAMCAMILPGISGSFILLLLGKYAFMLEALEKFDWPTLAIFLLGGLLGLLSFSRFLFWLLHAYTDYTIALLAGFMLGSIPKTWPWKSIMPAVTNVPSTMLLEKNISPIQFQAIYHKDPHILQALLCICIGSLLIIMLHKLKERN